MLIIPRWSVGQLSTSKILAKRFSTVLLPAVRPDVDPFFKFSYFGQLLSRPLLVRGMQIRNTRWAGILQSQLNTLLVNRSVFRSVRHGFRIVNAVTGTANLVPVFHLTTDDISDRFAVVLMPRRVARRLGNSQVCS